MKPRRNFFNDGDDNSLGVRLHLIALRYPTGQELFRRGHLLVGIYSSVLAVVAIAFVGLSVLVKDQTLTQLDLTIGHSIRGTNPPAVIQWLTQSSIYAWLLTNVSALGDAPWNYVTYIVGFLVLFALSLRIAAVVAVGGSILATVSGVAMRNMVNSTRPSPHFLHVTAQIGGGGFPSGHVMMYATLFGFAFYVVIVAFQRNPLKVVMLTVLALLVILIGPSRVYLGHHWPTDIVGAYLLSLLIVAGMIEVHLGLLRHFAASREAGERSTVAEALDNHKARVISRNI